MLNKLIGVLIASVTEAVALALRVYFIILLVRYFGVNI